MAIVALLTDRHGASCMQACALRQLAVRQDTLALTANGHALSASELMYRDIQCAASLHAKVVGWRPNGGVTRVVQPGLRDLPAPPAGFLTIAHKAAAASVVLRFRLALPF